MAVQSRLFVIGAKGYIGRYLVDRAKSKFVVHETSSAGAADAIHFQLAQPSSFNYANIQSTDVFLLAAAISSPDVCAKDHEYAWSVNVTGSSKFIAEVIARRGRIIFFSSDAVYGERKAECDELADCRPAGEYAAMKYEVERRFHGHESFKSIRLSYVFSKEDKFTKYLIGCSERNEEAELFHPFYRAVVCRADVVDGVLALVQRWEEFPQYVFNFGGPQLLSRVQYAECLQRMALPNLRFRVTEPDEAFFKNRPRTIAMSSPYLAQLLGRPVRTLCEAVGTEFGQPRLQEN